MIGRILMWLFATAWVILYILSNKDAFLIISQLWVIASLFVKDNK